MNELATIGALAMLAALCVILGLLIAEARRFLRLRRKPKLLKQRCQSRLIVGSEADLVRIVRAWGGKDD